MSGNSENKNNNDVEENVFGTDTTNNNVGTNNATNNVFNNEDLLQLLDSEGGSYVRNVQQLDEEDFSNCKNRTVTQMLRRILGAKDKGLVVESFDWDEESLFYRDEGLTTIKAFMAIVEDEP
ncbi:hypothetical protein Tco_0148919 [Tanacetum coccineum]